MKIRSWTAHRSAKFNGLNPNVTSAGFLASLELSREWDYARALYKKRNSIERLFRRLKASVASLDSKSWISFSSPTSISPHRRGAEVSVTRPNT